MPACTGKPVNKTLDVNGHVTIWCAISYWWYLEPSLYL